MQSILYIFHNFITYSILAMIKSFVHKGLEKFFYTGITSGIQVKHSKRLRLILDLLDGASNIQDLNFPGSNLHRLKGDKQELWSIKVSGNWRIIFKFARENVYLIDYLDYH